MIFIKRYHRITVLILNITLIFFLAGCNVNKDDSRKEELIFSGQSQNWEGIYKQQPDEILEEDKFRFILKYKGDDINGVGTFDYEFGTKYASVLGGGILNGEGVYSISGIEIPKISGKSIITVTIKRSNDVEETFTMSIDN